MLDTEPGDSPCGAAEPRSADLAANLPRLVRNAAQDSAAIPDLADIVKVVASRLRVPIAQVHLADGGGSWRNTTDAADDLAFFAGAVLPAETVAVVRDVQLDPRFAGRAPAAMRFLAGAPLRDIDGRLLGTLCIADGEPRSFGAAEADVLSDLAGRISSRLGFDRLATELRSSEDHFRHAIDLNPQILWTASSTGAVDEANRRWRTLVGSSVGEPIGDGWARAVHPDDVPGTFAAWAGCLQTGQHLDREYRLRMADGAYRWYRARAVPRRGADGRIMRWYGSLEDIHEAKLGLMALRESEQRLRFALEIGHLGAWDLDLRTRRLTASDICAGCFGWAHGEQVQNYDEVLLAAIHPEDQARHRAAFEASLATRQELRIEYRTIWPDGSTHWIRFSGRPIHHDDGTPARMVGLVRDITEQRHEEEERRRAEAQTAHLAHHDALTGLANRRLLNDRLEQALAAVSEGAQIALLSIDLDRFKAVNDTLGHGAGDSVLRLAAERLLHCARQSDTVARYGGDEFVVLYVGFASRTDVHALALRVLAALSTPFDLDGHQVELGGSIGISVAPEDTSEAAELWRNADTALYRSKRHGRGVHQFFDSALDARPQGRALNLSLRDALGRDEFRLVYQPLVDLASGRCTSFEALLRWESPVHGPVSPAEFILIAEKTGWIVPIGRWALREACREAASWPGHVRIAVNLSAVQFNAGGLESEIAAALAASGLAPERLELEVTETLLLHDNKAHLVVLEALRLMGVHITLDDFGTGYSSLSHLRQFTFDMIKIDESLVGLMPGKAGEESTVRAIAGLGRTLGISTTAEGVETTAQLRLVRDLGCTQAQGNLLSAPLQGADVAAALDRVWLDRTAVAPDGAETSGS